MRSGATTTKSSERKTLPGRYHAFAVSSRGNATQAKQPPASLMLGQRKHNANAGIMRETKLYPLPSTMMEVPLTIRWIFEHAMRTHPHRELISRDLDGSITRITFAEFGERVAQLAHALTKLGVAPGDRVASFATNTHRHLELYYAVPMIGAVLHTVNIRLPADQLAWMFEHANDLFICADLPLVPLARAACERLERPPQIVAMSPATMELPDGLSYEHMIAQEPTVFQWPELDERSAATLCYTSATTGLPKGVLFSHRSQFLHAFAALLPDALGVHERDSLLMIVPMFHVNAWGSPFAALLCGASLVMPGVQMDSASLIDLIERESVSMSIGVPTVWLGIRDYLQAQNKRLPTLQRIVIGGSALPPKLYDDLTELGIQTIHAWGMTEMSPIGTISRTTNAMALQPVHRQRQALLSQGVFSPIVAAKLLDDTGKEVAHDGRSIGTLWVRGFAVTGSYYRAESDATSFCDGYFCTGDIGTLDEFGYFTIIDRAKDLVKSGGEWISSVDVENTIMGHPGVVEAAVVGITHPKWQERPLALVVARENANIDEAAIREWLSDKLAKWWIPDQVIFIDAIPRSGTGKFLKRDLRERFKDVYAKC